MAEKPEQVDRTTDLKMLEYESLLAGYHSRDESMPRTFYEMTQVFSFLFALIAGVKFIEISQPLLAIIYFVLSFAGTLSLLAFLINLQGLSSSKSAIRERCAKLEGEFGAYRPRYWVAIANRRKFVIESWMKPYSKEGIRELRTGGFGYVAAAQVIFILWFIFIASIWFINIKF